MGDDLYYGGVAIAGGGVLQLVFAWLIGIQGRVELISNYRAHPERYPDREGLGRWMAVTLVLGGLAFCAIGGAVMTGAIGKEMGPASVVASLGLVLGAFLGLARYRRKPRPADPGAGPRRSPRSPTRR